MREVAYRYQVLRNGVPYVELEASGTPSVRFQSGSAITRSFSGTLRKPAEAVNWFNDRLRPQMWLDGQWHNLGVFVASSVTENYANGTSWLQIEAMDRALLVKQVSTEGLLHLSAGTRYLEAVKQLLLEAGIASVLADDSADVLATDREDWNEGTSYLVIINALLSEISFDPLWFDADGTARLSRYAEPSAERIDHVYRADEHSVIADKCQVVQDIYNPTNVFKVIVSNADLEEPMTATAVNDSATSPISTVSLGRRILAPIVRLDNIASQTALQDYADRLRFQSQLADEKTTFTTANMPNHGYMDVIALEHERLSGVYQETDWTMALSHNGQMTHKAKRMLYI